MSVDVQKLFKCMRSRKSYNTRQCGFTRTHLVIIFIILGGLTFLAIPIAMDKLPCMLVRAVAQRIVSDIYYARSLATATHDSVWVDFDVGTDEYSIYRGSSIATRYLVKNLPEGPKRMMSFLNSMGLGVHITSASFGTSSELLFDSWSRQEQLIKKNSRVFQRFIFLVDKLADFGESISIQLQSKLDDKGGKL